MKLCCTKDLIFNFFYDIDVDELYVGFVIPVKGTRVNTFTVKHKVLV